MEAIILEIPAASHRFEPNKRVLLSQEIYKIRLDP